MSKQTLEQKEKRNQEEHTDDVPMSLTSHLGELRKRLVRTLIVIIVVFVGATVVEMELNQPILSAFRAPLDARGIPLVFLELTEPFFTYLRIGLYASLFFYPSLIYSDKSGCLFDRRFFRKNVKQSGLSFCFHIHFLSAEDFSAISS